MESTNETENQQANKTLHPTAGKLPVWIRASIPTVDELLRSAENLKRAVHSNTCNTRKQPILPFAITSGAVGFVLVLIWIGAIVAASHNYMSEGADTKLARDLQMPLETLFRFLAKSSLPNASVFALTIGVPVFLFAFITFPILRASKRQSLPQELEDQEAESPPRD